MTLQSQITAALDKTPIHNAETLTGDNGLARVVLKDQIYTLRITRAGKLILTK
jgi:hemin uptake protein HemP